MIGGGARHMLRAGARGDRRRATRRCSTGCYRVLLDYYEANIAVHTAPFPGALDALDALRGARRRGWRW